MAITCHDGEIYLSDTKFPLTKDSKNNFTKVSTSLISQFPGKVIIGDYDKASQQLASEWITSDQRGGILIEKMDEAVDQDRCWWSTCNLGFKGHNTLPPLATEVTIPSFTALTLTNGDMELTTGWTGGARDSGQAHGGTYSWVENNGETYQDIITAGAWDNKYRGVTIKISGWMYASASARGKIGINDGIATTYSSTQTSASWSQFSVTRTLDVGATRLRILLNEDQSNNCYFDDITIDREPLTGDVAAFAKNNDELYMALGNVVSKLNVIGNEYEHVQNVLGTITALTSSVANSLYVNTGDAYNYWYMSHTTIEDCEDVWDELIDPDVTSEIDLADKKVGSASVKLTVAAGCAAGDILATEVVSVDMSAMKTVTLWLKSSVAIAADDLQLLIDDSGNCASPIKSLNIPALVVNTWTKASLDLGEPSGLGSIISVGIKMVVDKGAFILHIDQIQGQTFTETDVSSATLGIHWDSKLWKMDSAGEISHAATPNAASPSWTTNGTLANEGLSSGDINSLYVYRDADGNPIIYAGTKIGLFAHDTANSKWVATELALPDHDTCGKGLAQWREGLYVTAGLDVIKYIAGSTATISFTGLSKDDGLPSDYRGEIVKLIPGYNELYALVDSSLASGTNYSTVMAYDGKGWQCKFLGSTSDDTMHTGIVSSVYDYRLWFDHNSKVYYIKLEKDIRNPKKITNYPYAAAGLHITPWFDAGWENLDKLALSYKVFCVDTTANETVQVSYRIDYATTDIGSVGVEWTSLGTIVAAGDGVETEYEITANVGKAFQAIQFRFDLVGGTSTLSPDILWVSLKYLKLLEPKWGWSCTVDCSERYNDLTASELIAKIETLAATQTLLKFVYRDEISAHTQYVKIAAAQGMENTGEEFTGKYNLSLVSP